MVISMASSPELENHPGAPAIPHPAKLKPRMAKLRAPCWDILKLMRMKKRVKRRILRGVVRTEITQKYMMIQPRKTLRNLQEKAGFHPTTAEITIQTEKIRKRISRVPNLGGLNPATSTAPRHTRIEMVPTGPTFRAGYIS
jgi:hypothetical protein